jgi:hypothetical protein
VGDNGSHTLSLFFQNRKENPTAIEFARARILRKAEPDNPGAYLAKAIPRFMDNWQFEIEQFLVEMLALYIKHECGELYSEGAISVLELKSYGRAILEVSDLPHDPADDPGLFDRAVKRAAGQFNDLVPLLPIGYEWNERAKEHYKFWRNEKRIEPKLSGMRIFTCSIKPVFEDRMAMHCAVMHDGGLCDCHNPTPPAEALAQYRASFAVEQNEPVSNTASGSVQ